MEQFCQSCGMPLTEDVLGTEANGEKSEKYCSYCYQDGKFTAPDLSMNDMLEIGVSALLREGMKEQEARGMMQAVLPNLQRWQSAEKDAVQEPIRHTTLSEIRLFGIAARTSNGKEMTGEGIIAKLWEQFWHNGISNRIPGYEGHQPVYGCYTNYENGVSGEYTIFIGIQVEREVALPEGLEELVIPAATYVVFQSGEQYSSVAITWQNIWKWAETGQAERTFTGDFEVYEDGKPTEIYIAVQQ